MKINHRKYPELYFWDKVWSLLKYKNKSEELKNQNSSMTKNGKIKRTHQKIN